jgi:dimethylamine/trimethylamine dehydrogenase
LPPSPPTLSRPAPWTRRISPICGAGIARPAQRAQSAGFDIVYVYAAHGFGTLQHFLSRRYNTRSDEYGGSLVNRVRLLREIIEDTKEAVGERCAVAVRVTVDELIGPAGVHKEEMAEIIGLLAELPDL